MTKIQQMLDAGLPIIENESNEGIGAYSLGKMSPEQLSVFNKIIATNGNIDLAVAVQQLTERIEKLENMP